MADDEQVKVAISP